MIEQNAAGGAECGGAENGTSVLKAADAAWLGTGLRDFFLYQDLGVCAATGGKLLVQRVRAHHPPGHGTGWHRYLADYHVICMQVGWARFMLDGREVLLQAGDCLTQGSETARYLFDYAPDMEYLEIVSPADFRTIEAVSDIPVPSPTPW